MCCCDAQGENARLVRLACLIAPLLRSVKRREHLKSQLTGTRVIPPKTLGLVKQSIAQRNAVQEYKKLTLTLRQSVAKWERENRVPFLYRGISYLDDLKAEAVQDTAHVFDQAMKRAARAF